MRALIVDDEPLARLELRQLLRVHPEVAVVGEAASVAEAKARMAALKPDLLFLDIQMPGGSGFDLLAQLESAPSVIFTTAFDAHALRAFEVSALDYLLKPIEPQRLATALEKARRMIGPQTGAHLERLFIRDGERCWFVPVAEVRLFASAGNYAELYWGEERPILARSLNQLEEKLDPVRFFRASRQHLVNLDFIAQVQPAWDGSLRLTLRGGPEVPMSRRQSQKFRTQLGR